MTTIVIFKGNPKMALVKSARAINWMADPKGARKILW